MDPSPPPRSDAPPDPSDPDRPDVAEPVVPPDGTDGDQELIGTDGDRELIGADDDRHSRHDLVAHVAHLEAVLAGAPEETLQFALPPELRKDLRRAVKH